MKLTQRFTTRNRSTGISTGYNIMEPLGVRLESDLANMKKNILEIKEFSRNGHIAYFSV